MSVSAISRRMQDLDLAIGLVGTVSWEPNLYLVESETNLGG
jgi:hypothetical protein